MKKFEIKKSDIIKLFENTKTKFSDDNMMQKLSNGEKKSIKPEDVLKRQEIDLNEVGQEDLDKINQMDKNDKLKFPKEIVGIFKPLDEVEKILSRLATAETNEDSRKKMYKFYEKVSKLKIEAMQEFNISK